MALSDAEWLEQVRRVGVFKYTVPDEEDVIPLPAAWLPMKAKGLSPEEAWKEMTRKRRRL